MQRLMKYSGAIAVTILCAFILVGVRFVMRASLPQVATGTWQSTGTLMTEARTGAAAALLPDGRILITGGDSGAGPLLTAEFFLQNGDFVSAPPMVFARAKHRERIVKSLTS